MKIKKFEIVWFFVNLFCVALSIYAIAASDNLFIGWVFALITNLTAICVNPVGRKTFYFIKGYIGKFYKSIGKLFLNVGIQLDK